MNENGGMEGRRLGGRQKEKLENEIDAAEREGKREGKGKEREGMNEEKERMGKEGKGMICIWMRRRKRKGKKKEGK